MHAYYDMKIKFIDNRFFILIIFIFLSQKFAYNFSVRMIEGLQNRWGTITKNSDERSNHLLQNLTIKQIEFNNQNNGMIKEVKSIRPTLPTKIIHNGYHMLQMKNKRMLPGLPLKPINISKKNNLEMKNNIRDNKLGNQKMNVRNFQILNSIIQILKTDPDRTVNSEMKNQRIRTQPCETNQFIQSREISSVKNSRGPKIIANQIMMLGNQKRKLVSEQKRRPKILAQECFSLKKEQTRRLDPFQAMQMTFYHPSKVILNEHSNISVHLKKLEQNQFKKY